MYSFRYGIGDLIICLVPCLEFTFYVILESNSIFA